MKSLALRKLAHLLIALALAAGAAAAPALAQTGGPTAADPTPLSAPQPRPAGLPQPDGTPKPGAGLGGNTDARSYGLVSGPGANARFVPSPATGADATWPPQTLDEPGFIPEAAAFHAPGTNDAIEELVVDGQVLALAVDREGTVVYAGGNFTTAGGATAHNIAKWDGTTSSWSALGTGVDGIVYALAVDGDGSLYAGGNFTTAGGVASKYIARWEGTTSSWNALGSGVNEIVYALAVDGASNLYAGGYFSTAGGAAARKIAKWDGTTSSWSALGSGMDGYVVALAVDGVGNLYAGGTFTTAGGAPANHVAKWDGTTASWSSLGSGMDSNVGALAVDGRGNLYAGGDFTAAGGAVANHIAKWDGTTSSWSTLGSGINGTVQALAVDGNGTAVFTGGNFSMAGGVTANFTARWDGTTSSWSALGSGMNGTVEALAADGNGTAVYAGGYFTTAGAAQANGIAKWDGTTSSWSALGSGMKRTISRPCAICVVPRAATAPALDGDLSEWDGFPIDVLAQENATAIIGPPPEHTDALASLQWGWDPTGLYLAVQVRDDLLVYDSADPAEDDVFELAIDGNNDNASGGPGDHLYRITQDGRQSDAGVAIHALTVAARAVPTGWNLEIFIPSDQLNLGGLEGEWPGRQFRFNWALGDDDTGGNSDIRLIAFGMRLDPPEPAWPTATLSIEPWNVRHFDGLVEAGRWELFGRGVLNDVFFLDSSCGWAAGTGVWKTTDGGATWRRIPILAGTTFYRIVFADRNRGWALGHDNRILRTEDGGESWLAPLSGTSQGGPFLLEYQAPDDLWSGRDYYQSGYYDYRMWGDWTHSTDGGLTWTQDTLGSNIETLDFFDRAHGWVVANDFYMGWRRCAYGLAKTLDAGKTWAYTCLPVTSWDVTVAAIGFGSPTHGWLAADAALWRSTDGGDTWAEQHTFPGKLSWIQAEDALRAWVRHGSVLWRTTDGGATWQLLTEAAPTRVSFRTTSEGWGTDGSSIAKTTDGGRTWRVIFTLPPARVTDRFWDALTGWRANGSNMERTTDGGATWRGAATSLEGIDAFKFVDARNGWAWHNASLGLAHTTDGGVTWQGQNTGSAALTDLQFVDARHGWVRNQEQVRGTVDGGLSWHELPSPPLPPMSPNPDQERKFNQLLFVDATRGWAVVATVTWGGGGPYYETWLAHTTDGGSSWGPLESAPVDRVTFLDRDHGFGRYLHPGWKCGTDWGFYRSDDGGRTWGELQRGATSSCAYDLPYDLYAADLERLWSPGMTPFIGYSSDGGLTWADQRAEAAGYGGGGWFDRTGRAFTGSSGGLLWYRATEVTAYHAYRPPQIDGNLADWASVPAYVLNAERAYRVLWATPAPLDASATLQAAWDAGNLYFAVRVYDDAVKVDSGAQPWLDDAIEIGLDGRHDHVRNYSHADDRQFTVTALGQIYESGVLLAAVSVARASTANGYILEFAIPKARLGGLGLASGALPGLNWTLIDDDDGGNADAKLEWTGTGASAANASWGQLRLSALEVAFSGSGTETPTPTPTATSTVTPTQTLTATPTASTTPTRTPTATATATASQTPTPTVTATTTRTEMPTATPTPTASRTPTTTPTSTPATGDLAGTAWLDADGDGTRDTAELGLLGVRIELIRDGAILRTDTTAGDGAYGFAALAPGTYLVRERQPDWLPWSTTPDEVIVIMAAGDTLTIDFGDWNGRPTYLPLILR